MYIVLFRPALQIVVGESTSYGMPIAWLGMMSTGYFVARLKPKDDPTHILVTYLCLAIPTACIVISSIFLTLQYHGVTDLSTAFYIAGGRKLIDPFSGTLVSANGVFPYATLILATVGLLFIKSDTQYESRLHWLAIMGGGVAVTSSMIGGNRASIVIFGLALVIGFMLSIIGKQRGGVAFGLFIVTLFGFIYFLDLFNLKTILESTLVFQRLSTRSLADDGRWVYAAQALRDLEYYGLKGGGWFEVHNTFLEIWLAGGILPFSFFTLLIGVSVVNGARLMMQQQVALRTRYLITSIGIALLANMMQGNMLLFMILNPAFFTFGVLSALVETDSPRERLTYSTNRLKGLKL